MRHIQTVGVWPVAFTGAARWAGPICKHGHVIGFHTNWKPFRTFPIDMAAFAINLKRLLVDRPTARFDPDVRPGFLETSFLEQVTTMEEMEPKAEKCLKVSNIAKKYIVFCWAGRHKGTTREKYKKGISPYASSKEITRDFPS